jgi:Family of unknown function (DUF6444)
MSLGAPGQPKHEGASAAAGMAGTLAELERRLAHLEALRRRSSKNSSKPPSSDGPKKAKRTHLSTGKTPAPSLVPRTRSP